LYSKIENGKMNDKDLIKMIYLGPQNIEKNKELTLNKLEAIKNFIID